MEIVVIGGNAAGMSTASQVKRQKPDWNVTVLEKGSYISYAACGIPYFVQGLVPGLENLITVTPREAVEKRKIALKLGHEVLSIDPGKQAVQVRNSDRTYSKSFDRLLISTGARPSKNGVEYDISSRVFTVTSLEDGKRLLDFIKQENPSDCAVIGGGYIAVEMVEAFKEIGLTTHLIHRRDSLSLSFEKEISDLVLDEMEKEGVVRHLNEPVRRVEKSGNRVKVYTENNSLAFDLVVVATGMEPNSDLAVQCGIQTGVKEAIRVNDYMQTSLPVIYSAGDCTATKNLITGKEIFSPLALKANKEGVTAGINISGGTDIFPGTLGSAVTKFCKLGIARTGLTFGEAIDNDIDAIKFTVTAGSKAHYYPGHGPLTTVLVAEKKGGRLLGAQMAGPVDSVKRIDVYAVAITGQMTVKQLYELDLAYAPPFSPVYDPVILAGRVGRKKFES